MPNKSHLHVSNPPPKPLLIWDGDCDFCRLWIERWRNMTMGKIDYTTYQKASDRFPEIPPDEFNRSLVLIQPDGTVVFAAEAVYRSLAVSTFAKMAGVELRSCLRVRGPF